jgi:hypothetical protein
LDEDDPKQALAKLKAASRALKAAQQASRETVKEVSRAKKAVADVNAKLERFEHPKVRARGKRR